MKELIWFFGSSAAGKKILIENTISKKFNLAKKLNITNTNIIVCDESLAWVSRKTHKNREKLTQVISMLIKKENNITVLIKGQNFDLENDLIKASSSDIQGIQQRVIYVVTNPSEVIKRLKMYRSWFDDNLDENFVLKEIMYEFSFIDKLRASGISVTCVDGSKDKNYEYVDCLNVDSLIKYLNKN